MKWHCLFYSPGEVQHLHAEVSRYDAQRESLAQELVTVTAQLEEQRALAGQLDELKDRYTEMEQRYNALLQVCVGCARKKRQLLARDI